MSIESENERIRAQISELQRRLAPSPAAMRDELAAIAARYDSVDASFGQSLPEVNGPLPWETPLQFRQRRLAGITKYSPSCKNIDTSRLGEDSIRPIEERCIQDAQEAAKDPASYPPRTLRAVKFRDEAGRECTRWVGNMWIGDFLPQPGGMVGHLNHALIDHARFRKP